ncbi:MAG TPA: hypothetical protein VFP05_13280 [Thermomicrobiales bacterium]|nr:hypothetical protein [Thermomicrobiales bacterium]
MSQQRDRIEMAIAEIRGPLLAMEDGAVRRLAAEVLAARRIVIYAMGRELLSLRAFGMRLVHHGLDAHIAGDVTALPVTAGDLVILSVGPGDLDMSRAMARLVRKSGARLAVITAQPQGAVPKMADSVYVIPAQTMANDAGSASILPMGTVYEIAMLVFVDLVAVQIRESTGQTLDEVRARHFNLE